MGRRLDFVIPADYDGRKVIHFLRGEAGLSSRLTISLKYRPDGILLNGDWNGITELAKRYSALVK